MASTVQKINAFLDQLDNIDKHQALTLYGKASIAQLAFEIECPDHTIHGDYTQITLTDGSMAAWQHN